MDSIYILDSDIVVPTGMGCELAVAVAEADLGRFSSRENLHVNQVSPIGRMDFLSEDTLQRRCLETVTMLITSMLTKLPRSLKPLPLRISVPDSLDKYQFEKWLREAEFDKYLSHYELVTEGGGEFIRSCINKTAKVDAMICISMDSTLEQFEKKAQQGALHSNKNPWGLILSEGAAGIVLTKKNVIETLKLKPQSKLLFLNQIAKSQDRRGLAKLVRKASEQHRCFGYSYSDMTNARAHVEDFGFAVGARAENFSDPSDVRTINSLWGYLGNASGPVCLALASNEKHQNKLASLYLYDKADVQTMIILERCE